MMPDSFVKYVFSSSRTQTSHFWRHDAESRIRIDGIFALGPDFKLKGFTRAGAQGGRCLLFMHNLYFWRLLFLAPRCPFHYRTVNINRPSRNSRGKSPHPHAKRNEKKFISTVSKATGSIHRLPFLYRWFCSTLRSMTDVCFCHRQLCTKPSLPCQ